MMPFAAQMACLTASGAAAGAAARPLTIFASTPGTVAWRSVAPVAPGVAGGAAGGSSYATPPGPSAAMAVGAAMSASANSAQMNIRGVPRTTTLFRRPAGLADGLARKEPAPRVEDHEIRPKQPWVPRSPDRPGIRRCMQGIGRSPERPNQIPRTGDRPSVQTSSGRPQIWGGQAAPGRASDGLRAAACRYAARFAGPAPT